MTGKKDILIIALAVLLMGVGFPAVSSAVDVFAECAWTDTDVVCYVYADASSVELRSGGVMLSYGGSLSNPVATKNEAEWFFGAGGADHIYMPPDTSTAGEVVFIVGKLDTTATGDGVTGARALIGTVAFDRLPGSDPALFGLGLALGRGGDYVNFVNVGGVPLDSPFNSTMTVVERGDANASGSITSRDLNTLRAMLRSGSDYVVYADCNASGTLTSRDFNCLRAMLSP